MTKLKRLQAALLAFFHERDLAQHDAARETLLRRFAHFWLLVGKSFIRNRCLVRASALAYTTLLALIPMLAVALSVTTSLLQNEGEKPFRELIDHLVSNIAPALNLKVEQGAEAAMRRDEVVTRITDFVGNIQSGTLGATGMAALIIFAIGVLRTIEATFNDIWGVNRGRGLLASFVQYWACWRSR
jgi:membrane protein